MNPLPRSGYYLSDTYQYISGTGNSRRRSPRIHRMAVPPLTGTVSCRRCSRGCVFAFPVQSKERQDRKQRKDSSHWARNGRKALLKEHADQDQHQKNNAWNIRGKSEISRMQHGKDIPRACSSCFLINSCKAAKSNQKQNAVFDQRQFFCQLRFDASGLLFTFLTDYTINCVHCIPQTSKSSMQNRRKNLPKTIVNAQTRSEPTQTRSSQFFHPVQAA